MRFPSLLVLSGLMIVRPFAQSIFEGESDIGQPKHPGRSEFNAEMRQYTITGGGSNMWFSADAFHFLWKKVSGDVSLAAQVKFLGTGGDPHRKACLIVRQTLDPESPYADAALHGDGLTSLQYREAKGARTYEIQANLTGPERLRIEKRGKYVSMSIARAGEELHPAGGSFRLELQDPFYIGFGVCAHNDAREEAAVFSHVELASGAVRPSTPKQPIYSTLETITIASKDRRAIFGTTNLIEAPNWSATGGETSY